MIARDQEIGRNFNKNLRATMRVEHGIMKQEFSQGDLDQQQQHLCQYILQTLLSKIQKIFCFYRQLVPFSTFTHIIVKWGFLRCLAWRQPTPHLQPTASTGWSARRLATTLQNQNALFVKVAWCFKLCKNQAVFLCEINRLGLNCGTLRLLHKYSRHVSTLPHQYCKDRGDITYCKCR